MTAHGYKKEACGKVRRAPSAGRLCFAIFSVFCLFLILRNANVAIEGMNRGLRLCAVTVIPSLFPFMVISEWILSQRIGRLLVRPFAKPLRWLFQVSEEGACCMLLGILCGFPIGARCAMTALDDGRITKDEAERILASSCNPSSAFLINAVGISLWGNRAFGITLYATVILSQLLMGFLLARLSKAQNKSIPIEPLEDIAPDAKKGASVFTEAVRSSCFGMLLICAYVVFFSTLGATLECVMEAWELSPLASALPFCLLELSSGVSAAATVSNSLLAALLCAFSVGWSGISVHCQLLSICDGRGLRFRKYFLAKLLQGGLCVLFLWLLLSRFPTLLSPAQPTGSLLPSSLLPLPLGTVLFFLAMIPCLMRQEK